MSLADETVPGNYHVVNLPDGQVMGLTKLSSGKWVPTEDRIGPETEAFNARFNDTETIPSPVVETSTEVLRPDISKTMAAHQAARDRLDAYLGTIIGDPDAILRGEPPNKVVLYGIRDHAIGMIRVFNDPKWNQVLNLLTTKYGW